MGKNEYLSFGNKIKQIRIDKGLSQKEAAEQLGLSYSTYSNYENNNRTPKYATLKQIADGLEVSIDDLISASFIAPLESNFQEDIANSDMLNDYMHEVGEFLYYNPKHKALFDASMEVKPGDVELAKQMLDRINGKSPAE